MRLPRLSGHYLGHRYTRLGLLIMASAVLQAAAGIGMAYLAGFSAVWRTLGRFSWPWLIPMVLGLLASFVGYYFAYQGIYRIEGGPTLSRSQMRAVVTAGFGGYFAHGGGALDTYALQAAGADKREAQVRVTCLGGLEHGILGLLGTPAAIALLAMGLAAPPLDFSLPWAIIPVPGFLLAFWLAERYRSRFRHDEGWRGGLGVFLDAIHLVHLMFRQPRRSASGLVGMAVFWVAEALIGWTALACFGFQMDGAQFFLGLGTGMVFTRRTGPLAGAGVLEVVLPITVWYSGAPLATAVVGMFAYRALSLWLPMPFGLGRLRLLREMGKRPVGEAEGTAESPGEPALRREAD